MDADQAQPSGDPPKLPPELARMVAAARSQPLVVTCVSAEAVTAGLERERLRQHGRRTMITTTITTLAAAVAVVALLGPLVRARPEPPASLPASVATATATAPEPAPAPTFVTIPHAEPASLADAVRLRSTAAVEVRGPWAIAVADGSHEIELDPAAAEPLVIALPGRTLELVEGRVSIEWPAEAGPEVEPAVRLHTGVAAWIAADGSRTQIRVDRVELEVGPAASGSRPEPGPSAAQLAARAEQQLTAGDRDQAIATYQQLVRKHPRASQARAGLLDLARLLRVAGREQQARCAYQLYLERWPDSAVHHEVEAQLTRLGPGPACPQ